MTAKMNLSRYVVRQALCLLTCSDFFQQINVDGDILCAEKQRKIVMEWLKQTVRPRKIAYFEDMKQVKKGANKGKVVYFWFTQCWLTATQATSSRGGWLYVMWDKNQDGVKIGRTINFEQRLQQARTFAPEIRHTMLFRIESDVVTAERTAHKFLEPYRRIHHATGGTEWFNVSLKEAALVLIEVMEEIDGIRV